VIDAFNRELILRVVSELRTAIGAIRLPLSVDSLDAVTGAEVKSARSKMLSQTFGADADATAGQNGFDAAVDGILKSAADANFRASHAACSKQWNGCASSFDRLKMVTLPSRRRFWARVHECNVTLLTLCVGPASGEYEQRLGQLAVSGAVEYGDAFHQRISHLFVLCCAGGILVFRYLLHWGAAEFVCWLILICIEVLPRINAVTQMTQLTAGPSSFWESPSGVAILQVYEAAVYNEYIDADDWLQVLLVMLAALVVGRKCYTCCCSRWADSGDDDRPRGRRREGRDARDVPRRYRKIRPGDDDYDDYDDDYDERPPPRRRGREVLDF